MSKKGPAGQNEVAKLLKEWWSTVDPCAVFASTPKSGGWKRGPEFRACGDVMCSRDGFPFSVEVKRRERWDLRNVLGVRQSPVWAWWEQAQRDAARSEPPREPMMWFRQNRKPWFVMLRVEYVEHLHGVPAPDVVYSERAFEGMPCGARPCLYLASAFLQIDPRRFQ